MASTFLEKGSNDYIELIERCASMKGTNNSYSLCGICWSFLTNYQKKNHDTSHNEAIYTPSQYCTEELLVLLAKKHKKYEEKNHILWMMSIQSKPFQFCRSPRMNQIKIRRKKKNRSIKLNLRNQTLSQRLFFHLNLIKTNHILVF